eukprot:gnl/TRDRNA2_/TRDRNA2_209602_c0_seq1.p2 gnl/TRDRNA2_/TRDRNA2_209602_c0~~gnl/TRDRNA2_/TRDRNA2_209602_c0_seq1.p2  ORF type:complete len:138 (-),score=16.80 gnl/TRDRNA2_/TRDRNA2_209602_c0_seq1:71-484(-)
MEAYTLRVDALADVKFVLTNLIDSGLSQKRKAAEIGLALEPANFHQSRLQLHKLSGNQARYKWLDEAGCDRAREIRRLRMQLWHLQRDTESFAAQGLSLKLNALTREHFELSSASQVQKMRKDIRALLAQGALAASK